MSTPSTKGRLWKVPICKNLALKGYALFNRKFINVGLAIHQWMQRVNWHCYVIAALPEVKKYFLLQKSAVFSKLNISKSSWNFLVKMVAFCKDKKLLHLTPKTWKFSIFFTPLCKAISSKVGIILCPQGKNKKTINNSLTVSVSKVILLSCGNHRNWNNHCIATVGKLHWDVKLTKFSRCLALSA